MKKNVKIFMCQRKKKIHWDDTEEIQVDVLDKWPDMETCIDRHYIANSEFRLCRGEATKPADYKLNAGFMKSVEKYCTTDDMKFRLIDSMTKLIYRIPCNGLRDTPIKENPGLRHFYVSDSWRVFYRRLDDYIEFEEFCPHKKISYHRRHY